MLRGSINPIDKLSIAFAADSAGQMEVLSHNGNTLGMDCAKVGILEEPNQIGLGRLLESEHGLTLEPNVLLEFHGDFPYESLEGELSDEKVGLSYKAL